MGLGAAQMLATGSKAASSESSKQLVQSTDASNHPGSLLAGSWPMVPRIGSLLVPQSFFYCFYVFNAMSILKDVFIFCSIFIKCFFPIFSYFFSPFCFPSESEKGCWRILSMDGGEP
jgi:hypothetical protein